MEWFIRHRIRLLLGVAGLLVAAYLLIGRPVSIESYRVLDERTIAVRVVTGDLTWRRGWPGCGRPIPSWRSP